jgi:hypothetical protein
VLDPFPMKCATPSLKAAALYIRAIGALLLSCSLLSRADLMAATIIRTLIFLLESDVLTHCYFFIAKIRPDMGVFGPFCSFWQFWRRFSGHS